LEASSLGAILTPLAHGRPHGDGNADPAKQCNSSKSGKYVLLARKIGRASATANLQARTHRGLAQVVCPTHLTEMARVAAERGPTARLVPNDRPLPAPVLRTRRSAEPSAFRLVPEYDAPAIHVVGGYLDRHPIAQDGADPVLL